MKIRFLLKGAGREGHHRHEVALVFFRKEGGGQRKVQIAGPCNNEGIQEQLSLIHISGGYPGLPRSRPRERAGTEAVSERRRH